MAAIQNGTYSLAEIPDPKLGPRRVDIETMYNKERYRPNYSNKLGLPVFLTKA
jgi:ATP-dependent phosphofructokinase / diphosphate-dependent phosphofructokinase